MNKIDHLLSILSEECNEVGQRCSKALRFGINEVQPGQKFTNSERITQELEDLFGVVCMLIEEGVIPQWQLTGLKQKREKIEKFLLYSKEQVRLK